MALIERIALRLVLVLVIVGTVLSLWALMGHPLNPTQAKILVTSFGVAIYASMGLACGAVMKRQATSLGARAGFVVAFAGALLFTIAIWSRSAGSHPWFLKTLLASFVVSFAASHASLLLLVELRQRFLPVRAVTRICIYAWAVLLVFMIFLDRGDSVLWRLVGATSTVGVFGSIAMIVLGKLSGAK